MVNEQHRLDTMTNNLANASTVGYKKEGATSQCFKDVLTVKIKDNYDGHHPGAKIIGRNNPGVKIGENYTDYTQGALEPTGLPLDFGIYGDGFFAVQGPDGDVSYTRNGKLFPGRRRVFVPAGLRPDAGSRRQHHLSGYG